MRTKRRSFLQTIVGFVGFSGFAPLVQGTGLRDLPALEADSPPPQRNDPGTHRPIEKTEEEQIEIVDRYDDEGRLVERTVCRPGNVVCRMTYQISPF